MMTQTARWTPVWRVCATAALLVALPVLAGAPKARQPKAPAPTPAAAPAPTAGELIQTADRARGVSDSGISWDMTIETVEDQQKSTRTATVKALQYDTRVEMTAPAYAKGQIILSKDREMWFTTPKLKKPILISSRMKLSGPAANGDIATTSYARDYRATLAGEEQVGGEDAWRLDLEAVEKNVTYDRIRYWVSKSRRVALKAEFLTVQGAVFKTATFEYGHTLKAGTREQPFLSRMTITDAAAPENVSTVTYGVPRLEEHPASLFDVNALVR
jgi:outer membrane lipoprotein-sorting protein